MKNVQIEFRGIDDFNRPVFKAVDKNIYFGSVDSLFSLADTKATIVSYFKENLREIQFFGRSFNCEPHGWDEPWYNLQIV